jgi:predicted acetyltransferase
MIKLIEPNSIFIEGIEKYKKDFISEYKRAFINGTLHLDAQSAIEFLDEVKNIHSHDFVNNDFVSLKGLNYEIVYRQFLAIDESNKIIGMCIIRKYPEGTKRFKYVGNVGYSISPFEKGKGYGNKILELCLIEAKKLNMNKLVVSVRE